MQLNGVLTICIFYPADKKTLASLDLSSANSTEGVEHPSCGFVYFVDRFPGC